MERIRLFKRIREIRAAANSFDTTDDLVGFEKFKQVWAIIKPASQIVKIVTRDKVDDIIDKLILAGDKVANEQGESEFVNEFKKVWQYIKTALLIAMTFTGEKVDNVLEEIIEWGDYITKDSEL